MPKVNLPFEALALYDYIATNPGELSFYYGDIIKITKMDYPGWWTGELEDGTSGSIPSNYVQKLTEQMKQKIMEQREAMQKLAEAKLREQELAAQQEAEAKSQVEGASLSSSSTSTPQSEEKPTESTQPNSVKKESAETKSLPTAELKSNTSSSTRTAAILSPSKPATRTTDSKTPATTSTPSPAPKPDEPTKQVQNVPVSESEQIFSYEFPPFGEAILDYTATRPDELSFQMGEILRIVSHPIKGWYKGCILKGPSNLPKASFKHLTGLIPSNLIVAIPEKEAVEKAAELERKKQLPRGLVRKTTSDHPLLEED